MTHYELMQQMGSMTTDAEADAMQAIATERGLDLEAMEDREFNSLIAEAVQRAKLAKKTYAVRICDAGVSVNQDIEATDIQAACDAIEQQMRETEEITDGNPDCEPRTEWTCAIAGDHYAECSLAATGEQNSAAWARCTIELTK
jgi:hypothetical protein